MADEKKKSGAAPADEKKDAEAKPVKSGKSKLIGIVAAVMIVEGIAVFGAAKMLGGKPEPTHAEMPTTATQPTLEFVELEVAKIRAPNVKDGKLVLWSVEVVIRAKAEAGEEHKQEEKGEPAKEGEGGGGHEKKPEAGGKADAAAMACPELARKIKMNERTIKDRLSRIVRSAEPQILQEDGLETIRRQVKFELGRILEDEDKIVEVLIPECTPFPTGF